MSIYFISISASFTQVVKPLILKILMLMLYFGFSNSLFSQIKENITVGINEYIEIPFADRVIGEPHLAINPLNDNHILIGAMMWSTTQKNEITCITMVSFDGGKNWKWNEFADKNSADPWGLITPKGEAVFTMLGTRSMWTYHSSDGGLTWKDSVNHGTNHDHQTLALDGSTSKENNGATIYVVSQQGVKKKDGLNRDAVYVSRSLDGGKSFNYQKTLIQNNLFHNTMTPVVLTDGTLIIPYSEYAYRSMDNKQKKLERNLSWTISSSDSAGSFSEPRFITELSSGFPVLMVDRSAENKDRLYWVTSSEKGKKILCFFSDNKGETWSEPIAVSESLLVKTIPNIAVNKNGVICVTWYEKEAKPFCQNFYYSISMDGGKTFSQPNKISDQTSCADSSLNANALRGGWSSGGHYTGIVARNDGDFQVVWADARNGRYQLYKANISIPKKK